MKIFQLILLLVLNSVTLSGVAQSIIWEKSYGSKLGDQGKTIDQTNDGGYIVAGWIGFDGNDVSKHYGMAQDCWVVKLDSKGNLKWENTYGGTDGDRPYSIQQTTDGGYIMAGLSGSSDKDVSANHGATDYWVVKMDPSGNIEWENNLGGTKTDVAYSIRQTSDGGYVVAGTSRSSNKDVSGNNGEEDIWIVKLDASGKIEWENNFGSSGLDSPSEVLQTYDDGFIVVGRTGKADNDVSSLKGKEDCWVIRLNSAGKLLWEKTFGGSEHDGGEAIIQTADSGFVVASSANSSDKDVSGHYKSNIQYALPDYWLFKINQNGVIQWDKNYGGTSSDRPKSIISTKGGGYAIAGVTSSSDKDVSNYYGNSDYWVVKINHKRNIQWERTYGGTGDDNAKEIIHTNDGNFVVVGHSKSDDKDVSQTKGGTFYWITKLSKGCSPVKSTISKKVCNQYTVPSKEETYYKGGTYYDTLNNATSQGCDSIITINLTINNVDSSVTKSGTTLEANVSGATYQWLDCDNSYAEVSGAKSQSFTPSVSGNYAVAVTKDGCTDTSQCYQIQTTGIAANTQGKGLDIYPNPTKGEFTIQLTTNNETQTYNLQTLTGQTVQTGQLPGKGQQTIDVSNLSPAVYLLQVKTDEVVRTKKVVVE